MLARKRQNEILNILKENGGIVKMTELAQRFHVSNETIRRDLEFLHDQKLVQRVYGGAKLLEQQGSGAPGQLPHDKAKTLGQRKREAIGRAVAEMIHEDERLLLSTGSTVLEVAKHLKRFKHLTIVTNSLAVAYELSDTEFDIYILGGKLNNAEMDTYGEAGLNGLQSVFADRTIIGAGGITMEYGISDFNTDDFLVRNEMMRRSNQVIVASQSDKFGRNAFCIRNPIEEVDVIVTDSDLPAEYAEEIRERNIELVVAEL